MNRGRGRGGGGAARPPRARRAGRSAGKETVVSGILAEIAADRRRGAAEIAEKLLAWGDGWVGGGGETPDVARTALAAVARSQAALAPVLRVANDFLVELERREGTDEVAARRGVAVLAERWRRRLAAAAEALGLHLRRALEGVSTVYTYSASSTVRRALEAHYTAGHWFRVLVSEGRPGGEGARMAAALAEKGVPVRLGVDVWLLGAIEDEGAFLVGADALLPTRWVNKLGTAPLAARARDRGVAVVVAADTSKWLPPALAALPRVYDRDPAEIVYRPPPSLEAVNPYFEEIPYAALDRLITERGITRPQDLRVGDVPVARALR
ncbi:MAG TPA: hypothetical protein VM737_04050 [Gemmatimonadota bacterium]|nr:hypothetical protein [Gemmatimonadota bacterium]